MTETPFKCHLCQKAMKFEKSLKVHMEIVHNSGKNLPFNCSQCSKSFPTKPYLKYHQRSVHKLVQFSCYFCSKEVASAQNLDAHIRTHTEERPYRCGHEACKYASVTLPTLQRHQINNNHGVVHLARRKKRVQKSCYFCGESRKDLSRHMRRHTKEEPFSCNMCKRSCKSLTSLKLHVATIHKGQKPYNCSRCNVAFEGQLQKHKVFVHNTKY